ncbi:MAG TPA: hypothetical protein VMG30_07790 [Acidobacteriota bacterium]|nr:hypothetical protein [Acidobacteriota bacterium]
MDQSILKQALLDGSAPKQLRLLIAGGLAPIPSGVLLELIVLLLKDVDPEIGARAAKTLGEWDQDEICTLVGDPECHPSILEYFSQTAASDRLHQAILSNSSSPDALVANLAETVPGSLLETILDNRVRIIRYPDILASILRNPACTPEIQRLAHEIEVEFLGSKKKEYAIAEPSEAEVAELSPLDLQLEIPEGDLSLEGLPVDPEARQSEILKRLSTMSVREKMRYALFGNREIRAMLIRDSNKEVARAVLHSPKLTDNEIEAIASMRGVAENILREIGQSRAWTKSYAVVQNLVKNPKTPPTISQTLLFRLRAQDLMQLSRDRSVSDAVRNNAGRILRQRASKPNP